MPDPTNPQVPTSHSQTAGWLDGAPGGDLNLDDLFPNPETRLQAPPPQQPPAPQTPPAPPAPFIRTQTGTVYNSAEDTIRGIEEKDRIIAELRASKAAEIGADPLKRPASPEDPNAAIFKRLAKAAEAGNSEDYVNTLRELTLQTLAPYGPMIAEAGREKVLRAAASTHPGLRDFVGSAEYTGVLERNPLLREAIGRAEADPQAVGQLQEFYRLAYSDAVASRGPSVILQTPPTPNPRPTLTHSTPSLPPQAGQPYQQSGYSLDNPLPGQRGDRNAAYKAILEQGRARGLGDVDWGKVGL